MSFTKVNYVDNETIITADNLNNIQDAILSVHQNSTFAGDLNTLYEPGWHWIRCADCTNTPYGDNYSGAYGFLEIISPWEGGTELLQRFINYPSGKTYVRTSVNGWGSWINNLLLNYPVGAIYQSTSSTSPASLFGGTWEQITDRFLLSAGSSYTAGATGGAATHTLTINQMPSHNHAYYFDQNSSVNWFIGLSGNANGADPTRSAIASGPTGRAYTMNIRNTGGGQAHNNMPPYLVVYTWKRIS